MLKFTFDTNCIIDLDEDRLSASDVWSIVHAHREERVHASWVAVSASERQPGDYFLPTYDDFVERLQKLGVDDLPQLPGMAYWGLSYWHRALWAGEESKVRERQIHAVLFPNIEFEFADFSSARAISPGAVLSPDARKWRNAWCDRQMVWAHDHHSRDVFVTSDGNFRKLVGSTDFERFIVRTPNEAARLLP